MNRLKRCAAPVLAMGLLVVGCQAPVEEGPDTARAADDPAASQAATPRAATPRAAAEPAAARVVGEQIAEALADTNVFLLDVRRPDELEELGTVEGYTNIPIQELADRLDELPRDRPILTA